MSKISVVEYNLVDKAEWNNYLNLFNIYLLEVLTKDEYEARHDEVASKEYKNLIMNRVQRENSKFYICRIMNDNIQIGFVDYICYPEEDGKCLIGNFYIEPCYRNQGNGQIVFDYVIDELKKQGGKFVVVTPSDKAISFYLRNGFSKTHEISENNGEIEYKKILM